MSNMTESQFIYPDDLNPERGNSSDYHDHSSDSCFFQICQSCFWSASALYETRMIRICPLCESIGIDSLPISPNEAYTYDVNKSAGLSLTFKSFNSRK